MKRQVGRRVGMRRRPTVFRPRPDVIGYAADFALPLPGSPSQVAFDAQHAAVAGHGTAAAAPRDDMIRLHVPPDRSVSCRFHSNPSAPRTRKACRTRRTRGWKADAHLTRRARRRARTRTRPACASHPNRKQDGNPLLKLHRIVMIRMIPVIQHTPIDLTFTQQRCPITATYAYGKT